ncbi:CK1 family protein kinase [Histomonas meleagridis]|uniref:CK1 family protein kinase n=1 Tax=Histomonas meleagridis TaxID=135588 RepID=UPI0035598A0E|nr:CK1 family protein kinase [Histomonas meleagridis]KAH0796513.1 CK1 family protein kinase [Histomonas meleagridis]
MKKVTKKERKTFEPGTIVQGYEIIKLVGQGSYGDIYHVKKQNTDFSCALKVEYTLSIKKALAKEYNFFKQLNNLPYFPAFYEYKEAINLKCLAMELLGPSLTDVRKILPNKSYSISSTIRLGIEILRALEAFHSLGFIHRDVKPSQVLIRPNRSHPIALIDFGLSRRYLTDEGEYVSPRNRPGYVGTARYASLNAQRGKEQGRRDDLFSWFFSLLELYTGEFPWAVSKERKEIFRAKLNADIHSFLVEKGFPEQFWVIYRLIKSLRVKDEPNYKLIYAYLMDALKSVNGSMDDGYEWESLPPEEMAKLSEINLIPGPEAGQPLPPTDLPRLLEKEEIDDLQTEFSSDELNFVDKMNQCAGF